MQVRLVFVIGIFIDSLKIYLAFCGEDQHLTIAGSNVGNPIFGIVNFQFDYILFRIVDVEKTTIWSNDMVSVRASFELSDLDVEILW